jgi:hypothetical protein
MFQNKGKNFILIVILFVPVLLAAQDKGKFGKTENNRFWELSVFTGPSIFMGDIKYYRMVPARDEWRMAYGFSAGRRLSAVFGVKGMLTAGKLAGKQKSGNYRMESRYREMNLSGILYLDNLFGKKRTDRLIQPYLIAGLGLVFYNTDLFTQQPDAKIQNSGNKTEGILLLGLGIDFRINKQWVITAESANRGMQSDHMDLWVSGYPYDVYNITSIGIKFRFGFSSTRSGYYPQEVIHRKTNRGF